MSRKKFLRGLVLVSMILAFVQVGVAQGPFHDEGPFNDEVHAAVSSDGFTFKVLPGPFFQHASVPDVVELTNDSPAGEAGTLLLYFVDFSIFRGPGSEGLSVASSKDGVTWSPKREVILEGKVNRGAAVDPSVVELPDGKLRLYFFGSETTHGDPAGLPGDHKIYSAVSDDGIHFQVEAGVRFQAPQITDPEVIQSGGKWLMVLSRGTETLLARSEEGLSFVADPAFRLRIGGVPGAVEFPDGRVRVFATGPIGIVSAIWAPRGNSPPFPEPDVRVSRGDSMVAADPACVRRLDGSYYLIFKKKPRTRFPRP